MIVRRTKFGGKVEETLGHKFGGGEVWRQHVEGDKEERICVCGGKKTYARGEYHKQTLFYL